MKDLESEAWEDFLDMTISQALLWASTNAEPEQKSSEIAAAEPYFIGSHSGASGAWVSGPEDLQTAETKSAVLLGLRAHVDGPRSILRGRRVGRIEPQVLIRIARRRPHRGESGGEVHR